MKGYYKNMKSNVTVSSSSSSLFSYFLRAITVPATAGAAAEIKCSFSFSLALVTCGHDFLQRREGRKWKAGHHEEMGITVLL